jgi:hypothetical protein
MPGEVIRGRARAARPHLSRRLRGAWREVRADARAGLALVRLALPEAAPPDEGFLLHPSRLDGACRGCSRSSTRRACRAARAGAG